MAKKPSTPGSNKKTFWDTTAGTATKVTAAVTAISGLIVAIKPLLPKASSPEPIPKDNRVFPGQTEFFDAPSLLGTWDYNCNGVIEEQYTSMGSFGENSNAVFFSNGGIRYYFVEGWSPNMNSPPKHGTGPHDFIYGVDRTTGAPMIKQMKQGAH